MPQRARAKERILQKEETIMDHTNQTSQSNAPELEPTPRLSPDALLATKFLLPASSHEIIARPRLLGLLNAGLHRRVILVSAPAGFGKTTLLTSWVRSFAPGHQNVAWVSLDAGDNAPIPFWTYVLTALEQCCPGLSRLPFAALHDTPHPSWQAMLTALINSLARQRERLVLVLDNYEKVTEPPIQALLSSLIEHLPPTLCVVLATRTDPPFSLARLRAQAQILELRAEQLRATNKEMAAFLHNVMDLRLAEQDIQAVDARLQGWWAGMQLAALAWKENAHPDNLLQAAQGNQPDLFEYLVHEVLDHQPVPVQTFLLRTSILPRLCNALCNAVLEQQDSQLFLEQLERANLFLSPLDDQRRWYAYHPLFAEALRARLEQTVPAEVPGLHLRASRWYAAHQARSEAIQQALQAREWSWAAWLLEQVPSQHLWSWSESACLLPGWSNFPARSCGSARVYASPRLRASSGSLRQRSPKAGCVMPEVPGYEPISEKNRGPWRKGHRNQKHPFLSWEKSLPSRPRLQASITAMREQHVPSARRRSRILRNSNGRHRSR